MSLLGAHYFCIRELAVLRKVLSELLICAVLGQPLHAYARGHPGLRALVLHRLGHRLLSWSSNQLLLVLRSLGHCKSHHPSKPVNSERCLMKCSTSIG